MPRYHIYAIGNSLVDTEIEVSDQFLITAGIEKGIMTLVDEQQQQDIMSHLDKLAVTHKKTSGGSAANAIYAAQCFGAQTYYSCKVADDEDGRFYVHNMKEAGVTCNFDVDHIPYQGTTGKCLVLITPDAERTMNSFLGISATVSPENIDEDAVKNSAYVYLEGYLVTSDSGRQAAVKLRELAEQHGVKTSITLSDPNMVEFFKDGLQDMIGTGVDLLFCNEDEAKGWTGCDDIEQAAQALKQSASQFAITLGSKGALLFDGEKILPIAANSITAVDSNGAGDMFAGAFLYALSAGKSFEQAGKLASAAAAAVVSRFGPRLPLDQHKLLLDKH